MTTLHADDAAKLQAPAFKMGVESSALIAEAPAGYHFNTKAPMSIQAGTTDRAKPTSSAPGKVTFALPAAATDLVVILYLCDDKNTFCEVHKQTAHWDGKAIHATADTTAPTAPAVTVAKVAKPKLDPHGFIVNQPELAIEQAQLEKKPLLIDFFGIWCPPCNELDEQVFGTPEFKKQAGDFVKLKLDADAAVSWAFKSRFKISGYPTIVFATADLDEITRLVGFREKNVVAANVKAAYAARTEPFTSLKIKADAGDNEAAARIGQIYLNRGEWELARDYLKKDPASRESYLQSEIEIAEAANEPAKLVPALERAVLEFPRSPDSIDRRVRLAKAYGELEKPETEKKKRMLHQAIGAARTLMAHPEAMANFDLTTGDLWVTIAQAQSDLGETEESQKSWAAAAQEYGRYVASDKERGYNLERAACLWRAGEFAAADQLYQTLEKHYPDEFTFYFNHARMKYGEKKFPEASKLARKALLYSYGDNKLRVVHVLADSLKSEGKKAEAKSVIEAAIKNAALPDDPEVRTHNYVKALKELEKNLD